MSHFKERHPPMGSEKDLDNNQAIYNIDNKAVISESSSSSSEELDELSLRVRALLSEKDDDLPVIPFNQECQQTAGSHHDEVGTTASSQHDEVGTNVKVPCSTLDLKYRQHTDMKLPAKKGDEEIYSEHSFKDLTTSVEAYFDAHVGASEMPEQETDVLTVTEEYYVVPMPPTSSCKMYEHDISKDTSYYSAYDDSKKHIASCLPKYHHEVDPFVNASFTSHCPNFLTPSEEHEELLSTHKKSDNPILPASVFPLQPYSDKDGKEFLWSKCGDYDTPSLSASSIASSKRLEWDNAADIGYITDTADIANNCKNNRREPERYSVSTEMSNVSSQHATDVRSQFCVNKDLDNLEKEVLSQISYPFVDTLDNNPSKIPHESKDFNSNPNSSWIRYKLSDRIMLMCGKEPSGLLPRDSDNSLKELEVHEPGLSVRPKDEIYVQSSKQCGRKHAMHKKTINSEKEITCSTPSDEIQLEEEETKQTKNSGDSDTFKKKVSFISCSDCINIDHGQKEIPYSEQHKSHIYQTLPSSSVEYYSHIVSAPIYIDNNALTSQEFYSKTADEAAISNPESFPHIRWYPLPAYRNSQDSKNASSQTSLPSHREHMMESPESLDDDNIELSACGELSSFGTQTQTNENLKRDVSEATQITVGSHPHGFENLSYENVILSIQRNTNEVFPPLTSGTLDCQFENQKDDNSDGDSVFSNVSFVSEVKQLFKEALKKVTEHSETEKRDKRDAPCHSVAYVLQFNEENVLEVIPSTKTPRSAQKIPERFKSQVKYQMDAFLDIHKEQTRMDKRFIPPKDKVLLRDHLQRRKKFSKRLTKVAVDGKVNFKLRETVLPPTE